MMMLWFLLVGMVSTNLLVVIGLTVVAYLFEIEADR